MATTTVEQEALARSQSGGMLTYGYYRQPNGWITVSPMSDMDELKYHKEGWTALTQYGRVEMSSEYAVDNPLEPLFQRGGAKELCVEQILQMGLYVKPILLPSCGTSLGQFHKRHSPPCWQNTTQVHFPQLDGMTDFGPFTCRFCAAVKPTEAARNQHESVAHKEEKGDIRTGETLAEALIKGLGGRTETPATASVLPETAALMAEVELLKAQLAAATRPTRPIIQRPKRARPTATPSS